MKGDGINDGSLSGAGGLLRSGYQRARGKNVGAMKLRCGRAAVSGSGP